MFFIQISNINQGLSNIIERFIIAVDQFNSKYIYLTEWLELNTKEIDKELQLSTLINDNEKLKEILNTGIHLQTDDLQSLREYLETIDLIIKDFQQITENIENENTIKFLQQFELLSKNYHHFLKYCQQSLDHFEHNIILFNEINHLNEEFLHAIIEFDQNLSINEQNPTVNHSEEEKSNFFHINSLFRLIINYKFFYSIFNNNWIN